MLWDFAEGVRTDLLLQRWNPHIGFRAIICLKSEQMKVHVRGMFPLRVGDWGGSPMFETIRASHQEKVPFCTQTH